MSENSKNYKIIELLLSSTYLLLTIFDVANPNSVFAVPLNILWLIILLKFIYFLTQRKDKKSFLMKHIFEILSLIPVGIFPVFRLLVVLRVIGTSGEFLMRFFYGSGLIYILYTLTILISIGSYIFSYAENIDIFDSFYWSIVTVTTVGYGDIKVTTLTGKILSIIFSIVGVTLLNVLISQVTNRTRKDDARQQKQFDEIKKNIEELKGMVEKSNK